MQKVQLYIEGERLELFKDETVSITQSIQNIKDISKIFTEFTQSFSIPASPTNSRIFKHYYNWNIEFGYDARIKSSASIELNYVPWRNGFIALNGVDLRNNKAYAYRITFYGETINLKDILGEDLLSNLTPLSNESLTYNMTTVKSKLQVDPTSSSNKIIAPLITHTTRLTYDSADTSTTGGNLYYDTVSNKPQRGVTWSDLKYAIRVHTIVEAIESHYTTANGFPSNIVFSDDFLVDTNLDYFQLFMWLHRKKGSVEAPTQVTQYISQVNKWTESTSDTYAKMTIGTSTTSTTLVLYANSNIKNDLTFTVDSGSSSIQYQVVIYKGSSIVFESSFASGTRTFGHSELGVLTGSFYGSSYTVRIVQQAATFSAITFTSIKWEVSGQVYVSSPTPIIFNKTFDTSDNGNFNTSAEFEFNILEQIPEMKVIDFLTALFKMFNLTAYVEDGIIVVKTLNDYYASTDANTWDLTATLWQSETDTWNQAGSASQGTNQMISKFTDTNQTQIDVALPFKQVNFEFEGLGTLLAEQYNQLNNKGWGTEKYTLDGSTYDAPNKIYKVSVPFEHVQYERLVDINLNTNTDVQYGFFVDQNQQPYFGKPLLFYPILQPTSSTSISFIEDSTTNTALDSYIIPSNSISLNSGSDTSNINFYNETNEYTLTTGFTGTLFKSYYETYISEIFNTRRRIIRVSSYLPTNIISNIQLYDTVTINFETFRINSMTSDLTSGRSKLELINLL